MTHGHAMLLHAGLTAVVWRVSYFIGGGGSTVYPPLGRAKHGEQWHSKNDSYSHLQACGGWCNIYKDNVVLWMTGLQVRLNRWNTTGPNSRSLDAAAGSLLYITRPDNLYFRHLISMYYIYHFNHSVMSLASTSCMNIVMLSITRCCMNIILLVLWDYQINHNG